MQETGQAPTAPGTPPVPRQPRWLPVLLAGAMVAAVAALALLRGGPAQALPEAAVASPAVSYIHAARGKAATELSLPGTIQSLNETVVYARTNGYLRDWLVDMGDPVRAGQALAQIDTPELDREIEEAEARLAQSQAAADLARSTAERYRRLAADEAVSPQDVDERSGAARARNADVAAAQAHLRRLRQLRAFAHVTAPYAGTITARNAERGQLVSAAAPGSWLFRIAQTDALRVTVAMPQDMLRQALASQGGELLVREYPGQVFPARISRRAGAIDPDSRTMLLELRPDNPGHILVPGMYCQVRFRLEHPDPPVVLPLNALMTGSEGPRVAVLGEGDVVHLRKVVLGRDFGKTAEVVSGVREKERVVVNPRDTLEEGMHVLPRLQQAHAEAAAPASGARSKP